MENTNNLIDLLTAKENSSGINFDQPKKEDPKNDIKESQVEKEFIPPINETSPLGMEAPWKPIPISNLPSCGFGYPPEMQIGIRPCEVSEIRHYSTIDEHDSIDVDDKINHILEKNTRISYAHGSLNYRDIYQEDRFYIFMAIRDLTFAKGENKLMLPINKDCKVEKCILGSEIELKSNLLTNFKLPEELSKYYDPYKGCYILTPKNGEEPIELFIPTIGVVTKIRKIIDSKKKANKKYEKTFAGYSTFLIPNWRNLDEQMYDYYENQSKKWTYVQFNIVDQITKMISFGTKNQIALKCGKCGAEVTAPLRFRGGLRSLYIIPDIFAELL